MKLWFTRLEFVSWRWCGLLFVCLGSDRIPSETRFLFLLITASLHIFHPHEISNLTVSYIHFLMRGFSHYMSFRYFFCWCLVRRHSEIDLIWIFILSRRFWGGVVVPRIWARSMRGRPACRCLFVGGWDFVKLYHPLAVGRVFGFCESSLLLWDLPNWPFLVCAHTLINLSKVCRN